MKFNKSHHFYFIALYLNTKYTESLSADIALNQGDRSLQWLYFPNFILAFLFGKHCQLYNTTLTKALTNWRGGICSLNSAEIE